MKICSVSHEVLQSVSTIHNRMLCFQTQDAASIQDELRNGVCDLNVQIQEIYAAIHGLKGGKYDGLNGYSHKPFYVCISSFCCNVITSLLSNDDPLSFS